MVKQKYPPTPKDFERHPSTPRTDTLDIFVVAYGEIYLVTDTDEVRLKQSQRSGDERPGRIFSAREKWSPIVKAAV